MVQGLLSAWRGWHRLGLVLSARAAGRHNSLNFSEETFNSIVSSATLLRETAGALFKVSSVAAQGERTIGCKKNLPSGSGLLVQEISRGAPETHACHLWQSRYQVTPILCLVGT